MTGEKEVKAALRKPKRRAAVTRRLGDFAASTFSQPGFTSESPASFDQEMSRRGQEPKDPGEAILVRVDELTNAAFSVLRATESEPEYKPFEWSREGVVDPDLDTPHGFAMRVVSMSGSIRYRVMNLSKEHDHATLELVCDVLDLAANFQALQAEFVNGAVTATGRAVRAGAKAGGSDTERLEAKRKDRLTWKAEADRIRSQYPDFNKSQVARTVKKRLNRAESLKTILRHI